jgi:MFS family permease
MSSDHTRAFRILFFCLVSIGTGQSMLFAILPPAAREIGLTPFQVSTIFATSAAIWVFISPRWGRQSDVWGRRRVILIGLLGFATSMALLATMIYIGLEELLPVGVVYPLMIASRCVFALFGSGTGPASQAYVADRTTRTERTAGVALVSAALGLGQIVGPGLGAMLTVVGLLAPLYFSSGLAVVSALMIWTFLPEQGPPIAAGSPRPPRLRFRDPRILPFLLVATSLQAVQATTSITLAFFMQDTLHLDAAQTVRYSGAGFVVLAMAGLFTQLVLVQRFKPSPRIMMRAGVPLALLSFVTFLATTSFTVYLIALVFLGAGLGLVRPGNSAGASLAVDPEEQGSVAGVTNAIGVLGNVFGPLLGTTLFQLTPRGPYILNAALMLMALVFVLTNKRLRTARA